MLRGAAQNSVCDPAQLNKGRITDTRNTLLAAKIN